MQQVCGVYLEQQLHLYDYYHYLYKYGALTTSTALQHNIIAFTFVMDLQVSIGEPYVGIFVLGIP